MSIILNPFMTEKTTAQSEDLNVYTFLVDNSVNKIQVKEEVARKYNVNVLQVNILKTPVERKTKQTKRGLQIAKKSSVKKAMVKVAEGDRIDFYSNI